MISGRLHPSLHHPLQREWQEPHLHASNLVYPIFVTNREEDKAIKGFDPNVQWGRGSDSAPFSSLIKHLTDLQTKGLRSVMLFGVVDKKDAMGTSADDSENPVVLCLKALRKACPKLMLLADVCMCEYTDHGHCSPLKHVHVEGELIDNDAGVARLVQIGLTYAKAGAHMLCPSDMMDGRIGAIRKGLDKIGMNHVSIMAYTSKKASCMYAPFRAAVESTFKGDRKRYQQPIGGSKIAMRAMDRDLREGADVLLVKPCLFYGDIIRNFANASNVPIAAYVVSGEYKMLKDYGEATGCMDNVLKESHIGLLRAGVSVLITYFTPKLLDLIPSW